VCLLGLTGLLAGGLATLIADRWAFPLYAAAMFTPVLVGLGVRSFAAVEDVTIVLIVAFLGFTIRLHQRTHEMLLERLRVEQQLADAQGLAHVGSWEWDMHANRVTWSEELYRIYGVRPGSPAGYEAFLACVHPDDRARVKDLIETQFADRQPLEYEWRVQRSDGSVRHLHSRQVVVMDRGQPVRMLGTSHDITERRLAQEEVRVLRGILPICASCKRIRNDGGGWEPVESYVRDHSHAEFSHGLCPDCAKKEWG
jgi:PAS domain S-box-containing protein